MKNVFMYMIVIALVGVAAWFFTQKARNASNNSEFGKLVANEESSPLPSAGNSMNNEDKWVKMSNGLEVLDVIIGPGKEAKEGDVVATHYVGTLEDGTKFDSSYDRGQPFSFLLGGGMVIKGWDLGIVGMKVGGKRKLIIPASLGYGDRGAGEVIAPGATLHFEVELMGAETPKN